ncbi:copper amine oxidase N-terminal domain-containing protein [Desulforudis sp. 1088]|uniref:copper amine oxidase N-terminal domain-containing protein n=1 Tax=unclassified Candidatus Desulforudis TaxID=2635950 RepID=UPI003CE55B47
MIKARNKRISLLLAIVFVLTLVLPMGSAFAADPVKFTNATANGLDTNVAVEMGWIKGDLDQALVSGDKLYVTVELPSDVEWAAATLPALGAAVDWVVYGGSGKGVVKSIDSDYVTVEIDGGAIADGTFTVQFKDFASGIDSTVKIGDGAASDVKVKVTAKAVDSSGYTIFTQSGEFLVGSTGDAEVTVSAASPKKITYDLFKDKEGSKISITENVKNALSNSEIVYLELPENYVWDFAAGESFSGPYGLTLTLSAGNGTRTAQFTVSGTRTLADTVKITPKFELRPGADKADVVVNVFSTDADFNDEDVTIATFAEAPVTISVVDSNDLASVYIASAGKAVNNIKLKSDIALSADDTVILELPDGYEFFEDPVCGDMKNITRYSDNTKVYMAISVGKTEYTISNIKVNALPDKAVVGPLEITVSGTAGAEGKVAVANVKARATAEATIAKVKAGGLTEAAGDIVLTEAGKDTFLSGSLILSLPAGVKFADKIKYAVNDGDDVSAGAAGDTSITISSVSGLSSGRIDKITIKNIKYDLDDRFSGEVVVKISGTALVPSSLSSSDPAIRIANATTFDATKVTASFKVGDAGVAVVNGRTLVQVNKLNEVLGLSKSWDAAAKTAYFIKDGKVVAFPIDKNVILINGVTVPVDQGGKIIDGATYATLRGLEMAFGGKLSWDAATKTAAFEF